MTNAASAQRTSPHNEWSSARNTLWRAVVADAATISIALSLLTMMSRSGLIPPQQQYSSLTLITSSLLALIIFAYTGAYPRTCTPLNIAATEGLVKGTGCLLSLLAIAAIDKQTAPDVPMLATAVLVSVLVLLRREIADVWTTRHATRPWAVTNPANPFVVDADFTDASEGRFGAKQVWVESPSGYLSKRVIDIIGASILGLLAAPLLIAVAALIKLDSRGPVFVNQRRIGRGGVPFRMWKFRSMHQAVARYERSPVSNTDIRLTRIGRVLRRLSIDEMPQMLNVIRGEMSLVGPRPEMPFIVEQYEPLERLRLNAIPGVTGLWQISPARAMPIHKNVELDLYYIQHRNLFLDIAILLRTITAVIRGIGAA
jgi:lipopolysaccharide/colanic/teichoic acid biosynthesis glycosyltransferase